MGYAHGEVLVVLILAEGRRGVLALEVQGLAVVHSREQALPCAHQTASDSELAQVRKCWSVCSRTHFLLDLVLRAAVDLVQDEEALRLSTTISLAS